MTNEMRDRLVELFKKIEYTPYLGSPSISNLALQFTDYALYSICDDLIDSGVVVPPCKVEGTVYITYGNEVTKGVLTRIVRDNRFTFYDVWVENERYTYTVGDEDIFLTKEQAEQKLKEMRGE